MSASSFCYIPRGKWTIVLPNGLPDVDYCPLGLKNPKLDYCHFGFFDSPESTYPSSCSDTDFFISRFPLANSDQQFKPTAHENLSYPFQDPRKTYHSIPFFYADDDYRCQIDSWRPSAYLYSTRSSTGGMLVNVRPQAIRGGRDC